MERLEARVETLHSDVTEPKSDVSTLKTDMVEVKVSYRRLESDVAQLRTTMIERFDAHEEAFEEILLSQKSLTAAVVEAVTQLNLSRTYERRLQRLEEKVFGTPST